MTDQFKFTAISELTLAYTQGDKTSRHVATKIRLEVSPNLKRETYLEGGDGAITRDGVKPMTQALVNGIVANIHMAHQNGWWDSAEHLRYIMDEIQKGFVEVAEVQKDRMQDYTKEEEG